MYTLENLTVEQLESIKQKHLNKIDSLKTEDTSTKQSAHAVYIAINFHERAIRELDKKIEKIKG